MKGMARISPVPKKPHILKGYANRWLAKWPTKYGAIRGFGNTPVEAYNDLVTRYNDWRSIHR